MSDEDVIRPMPRWYSVPLPGETYWVLESTDGDRIRLCAGNSALAKILANALSSRFRLRTIWVRDWKVVCSGDEARDYDGYC